MSYTKEDYRREQQEEARRDYYEGIMDEDKSYCSQLNGRCDYHDADVSINSRGKHYEPRTTIESEECNHPCADVLRTALSEHSTNSSKEPIIDFCPSGEMNDAELPTKVIISLIKEGINMLKEYFWKGWEEEFEPEDVDEIKQALMEKLL